MTASEDSTVIIWDVQTGKRGDKSFRGNGGPLKAAEFDKEGKQLAIVEDDSILLWNLETGRRKRVSISWTCRRCA